jgi:hypothetical protein
MIINGKKIILIVLLIVSILLILEMIAGVPHIICMITAILIGAIVGGLLRSGIIKIEGIDIKK